MGGRFGDGAIRPGSSGDKIFKEKWHARALAITLAAGSLKQWNLDMTRHARECLPPKEYSKCSYYEKWIFALANLLVVKGVINRDEFLDPINKLHPLSSRKLQAADVAGVLSKGAPTSRSIDSPPKFFIGQGIKTRRAENKFISGGHTRLPKYVERCEGKIEICHGAHVFPDTHAHNLGEQPEHLYTVSFLASELWESPENPSDTLCVDIWESYLEPVNVP
mgnify:FL=1